MCRHHSGIEFTCSGGITELERLAAEWLGGAHQPEAGCMIETRDARRQHAAIAGDDEYRLRLEQWIADGQNEPGVLDEDAGALALGTQRIRAARLGRRADTELDDGGGEVALDKPGR